MSNAFPEKQGRAKIFFLSPRQAGAFMLAGFLRTLRKILAAWRRDRATRIAAGENRSARFSIFRKRVHQ
jgi:hypothetical protein